MTDTTLVLARILGGYMLIMGVGLLVHRRMGADLLDRLRDDFALTFTMGLLALIMGLVIVSIHNVWSGPLAILITVIGWLAVAEGAAIVLLRRRYITMVSPLVHGGLAGLIWGAVSALVGLWLLWAGLAY